MKFSKERPVKIVLLGVGGTGGYIAPHLYRLLYGSLGYTASLTAASCLA